MARVPADPETALRFGFDAAAWADEGLVDVLMPCPRWATQDNEIAVDLWKRLLRGTRTQLAPGLELLIGDRPPQERMMSMTPEQIVGAAAAHYSAGADGIYLFNFFDDPVWLHKKKLNWKFTQPTETLGVFWPNQLKWLAILGHPDRVFAAPRSHMLTSRDIEPLWKGHHYPFPTTLRAGAVRFFRLNTWSVPQTGKLELCIGVKGGKPPRRVFVNSRPCAYVRNEPCVPAFVDDPLCVYSLAAYPENAAIVEIIPDEPVTLTHLELNVLP